MGNAHYDPYLGLPDPNSRVKNPAAERARASVRELFRRDPPAYHLDNPWEMAKSYTDYVYLGIASIRDGMAAASVRVTQRRQVKSWATSLKAMPTAHSQSDDQKYEPADTDHPLCQLFNDEYRGPNPVETTGDLLAQGVMHLELFGLGALWITTDDGTVAENWDDAELYYVPKPLLMNPLPLSEQYPKGGYRVVNFYPGLIGGFLAGGSVEIDRRDMVRHRYPHPIYRFEGYSPQTAGAKTIDVLRAINTAWKNHMDHGWQAEAIVSVDGIRQEQADEFRTYMDNKFTGAEGHRIVIVDGEAVDVETLNQSAKDMEYQQGYDRTTAYVSALYRTSPEMLGFKTPTSYAALYAQIKAQTIMCLQPRANKLAADFTKQLARKYWPKDHLRVEIDLPKIDDPEELRAWASLQPGNLYKYNELRALVNLPAVEGGDVPANTFGQPQQPGPAGGAPGGVNGEGTGAHPLDSIGSAVLESLGVQGGDEPGQVQKATPWDEQKHARDGGRFASKPGAGAQPATPAPSGPVPPNVQRHPKVMDAMRKIATNAAELAGKVGVALQAAGMTPADLHGSVEDWQRIFITNHADVVSHTLGLDALTAGHVLTHLITHAVKAVSKHLSARSGEPAGSPRPPAPSPNGNGKHTGPSPNGPPRPKNKDGEGSLPPKMGTKKSLRRILKGLR